MPPTVSASQPLTEAVRISSPMDCTADERVAWVSGGFAEAMGRQPAQPVRLPIVGLLDGADHDTRAELFDGSGSSEKRFDRVVVHLVGQTESVDRFDLRRLRYVNDGTKC